MNSQLPKFSYVIILLIIPILLSIVTTKNQSTPANPTSVESRINEELSDINPKLAKKIKKLEKKLAKLQEKEEDGKNRKMLLIFGIVALIGGILLMLSGRGESNNIEEFQNGCLRITFGFVFAIMGIVLIVIGLII